MKVFILSLTLLSSISSYANCLGNIDCENKKLQRADTELNLNFNGVMNRLNSAEKSELRNIQRSWIAYRDASCAFEAKSSIDAEIVGVSCLSRVTSVRAKELKSIFEMRNSR